MTITQTPPPHSRHHLLAKMKFLSMPGFDGRYQWTGFNYEESSYIFLKTEAK
jgi:hypothetical protein